MTIEVSGDGNGTVPQPPGYIDQRHSGSNQKRGTGVSQIMITNLPQIVFPEKCFKFESEPGWLEKFVVRVEADIPGFPSTGHQKLFHCGGEGKRPVTGLPFGYIPGNDTAGDFVDSVADMDGMTVKVNSFPFESQHFTPAQPQKEGKGDRQFQISALNRGKQLLAFGFAVIGCRIGSDLGRKHPIGGILRKKTIDHCTVQSLVEVGVVTAHGGSGKPSFQKRIIVRGDMLWSKVADGKIQLLIVGADGIADDEGVGLEGGGRNRRLHQIQPVHEIGIHIDAFGVPAHIQLGGDLPALFEEHFFGSPPVAFCFEMGCKGVFPAFPHFVAIGDDHMPVSVSFA